MFGFLLDMFSVTPEDLPLAEDLPATDPRAGLTFFPRPGDQFDVDAAVAADAITEYLERAVIRAGAEGPAGGDRPVGDGQSLHLHATDPGLGAAGEWTILGRPDGIAVDPGHSRAPPALRGPARDLLLAMVRRATTADLALEVFGEPDVWDTWLARTPF
jgi:hypothetical protein